MDHRWGTHALPAFPWAPQTASLKGEGCCAHICGTHQHESFLCARHKKNNRDNRAHLGSPFRDCRSLCRESKRGGIKLRQEHAGSTPITYPPHLHPLLGTRSHLPLPGPLLEAQISRACFLPWCTLTRMCSHGGRFLEVLSKTCPPQTHINSPMQQY